MDYRGYSILQMADEELANFYQTNQVNRIFKNNEYLIIQEKNSEKIIDKYCYQNEKFLKVNFSKITSKYSEIPIIGKNLEQELAIHLLQDRKTKVKLLKGVYGSGKDFLMLHQALEYIENGIFQKIVFIRPNVSVANVPEIGHLPGTAQEKLSWTLGPIYDKVGGEEGVEYLMRQERLEMIPLLFIRGRSFENSLVYVCEGQNITSEIAKLIISRLDKGSELWINADNHQTDAKIFNTDNGISRMIDKLTDNPLFGYVYMPKTERSEVARLADLLD